MKEKISFACTVFNEEKTVGKFIESILTQSVKPNEIIMVDGGSTDGTLNIMNGWKKKSKIPIRIFVSPGNIAVGRNKYVKESKYDILFTGDSGTRFEKDWIKKMLRHFEQGAEIVIGTYYSEKPKNIFEKVIASRFPDFSKFSKKDWENFLPSNRQIAYRISSWKKLGDFPEWLDRADDTLMHMKAKKEKLEYAFAKDAKVYWHARDNLKSYLRLGYLDSVSDGICGIVWTRKLYLLEFAALIALLLSIPLSIIYTPLFLLLWPVFLGGLYFLEGIKILKKTKDIRCFFIGGSIMVLSFFAHTIGGIVGIFKGLIKKKN